MGRAVPTTVPFGRIAATGQPESAPSEEPSLEWIAAALVARGLVVLGPGGEHDGGCRGEKVASATLCRRIDLDPR